MTYEEEQIRRMNEAVQRIHKVIDKTIEKAGRDYVDPAMGQGAPTKPIPPREIPGREPPGIQVSGFNTAGGPPRTRAEDKEERRREAMARHLESLGVNMDLSAIRHLVDPSEITKPQERVREGEDREAWRARDARNAQEREGRHRAKGD